MIETKRRVGGWVTVTGGQHRGTEGTITRISEGKAYLETIDGTEIIAAIAWVVPSERPTIPSTPSDDVESSHTEEETPVSEVQPESPPPVKPLTLLQLRELAKQQHISVARDKADFLRLIRELEPDTDPATLKGTVLFDKVSELHISRLRSKQELQNLLGIQTSREAEVRVESEATE